MGYFDLGTYQFQITTSSSEARNCFDQGLLWLYGFNHEEAIVCFEKAIEEDPNCTMALWGLAYAIGPNYNKLWEMFEQAEKADALTKANKALVKAKASASTEVERDMVDALAARYPDDPTIEDFAPWNDDFAEAMRGVYDKHPDQLDVASVFAEALMNRTPWRLWNLETGQPADGASTIEAQKVLERAFSQDPSAWNHPGLLHMYIHLMEMSPTPEAALPHGDRLVDLAPESGHLVHMATHIDVLCGDYQNVIWRNRRAAVVDRKFIALRGAQNFYTVYRIHNVHFEAYGAMFLAQRSVALAAAEELHQLLPEPVVAFMPDFFEAFWGMKLHVMIRFGMWQEILDEPLPANAELFSYTTALLRYGRVVSLSNLGQSDEAKEELQRYYDAQAAVQETRYMFNNPCVEVLKIAEQMALGEYEYKSGNIDTGLEHLRQAVHFSDNLLYDEPWGWMQPPRHALAALLSDQNRFEEAELIYRADLGLDDSLARPCQHPGNIWSLQGLYECLQRRNETVEIVHVRNSLDQAAARAEVKVNVSCFCRASAA